MATTVFLNQYHLRNLKPFTNKNNLGGRRLVQGLSKNLSSNFLALERMRLFIDMEKKKDNLILQFDTEERFANAELTCNYP